MLVVVPIVFVGGQAVSTLQTLTRVERERDTWQRPDEILRHLQLAPGNTVVDLGSGAGYFSLKIAPRVAPDGRVFAVDLRSQSLAFLWIRAVLKGDSNLHIVRGEADNPQLPPGPIDAVLIANTYHELTTPEPILRALFTAMRSGGRMVVVDRGPRDGGDGRGLPAAHHEMQPADAERAITQQGFQSITRDDRLIDRPGEDDVWWLIVFRKP
jgi:predicted methyltransferase